MPRVRVVAIQAAQQAAAHEHDDPDAGSIEGGPGLVGVDPPEIAPRIIEGCRVRRVRGSCLLQVVPAVGPGLVGHDIKPYSPWNVRLITSICCSRVRRTKLTA